MYQNEEDNSMQNLKVIKQNIKTIYTFFHLFSLHSKWLDETARLTPSSIDYNEFFDQISVSHLNGTVKIYDASQYKLSYECTFSDHGILHQLKWNPVESNTV